MNPRGRAQRLLPFRAFRSRNYRLFFAGKAISLLGLWMQRTAMTWLVYRLTESPFWLGVVAFVTLAPSFFLSPFAGIVADRFEKRKLLILAQIAEALQAILLALLVITDLVQVWHLLVLGLFLGIASSFETPLRQAFIVDMLARRTDLPNAIALNSSLFNGARLIGPALAGLLIHAYGEAVCFLFNALGFLAVIYALVLITPRAARPSPVRETMLRGMLGGFRYSFSEPLIRNALVLLALTSLVAMPYITLLPIFADQIIGGGAQTLGFLTSATGVGALAGAFFLAMYSLRGAALRKAILISTLLFGVALIAFSLTTSYALAMVFMVLTGFAMMTQVAACNTLIQSVTSDDIRGRVMSHYSMAIIGTAPFGSLFAGWIALYIGTQATVMLGGVLLVLLGSAALFRKEHWARENNRR